MTDWTSGDVAGSIADMIAQTATEVIAENYLPGYTYIEQYEAYYNQETQCYYYPQTGLFYDLNKQCFLQYNQRTGQYEPIREKKKRALWSKKRNKRKAIENYGKKAIYSMDQGDVDVVECIFNLIDRVCFLAGDDEETIERYERKYAASNVYRDELDDWIPSSRRRYNDYYSDGSDPETDEEAEAQKRRIEEREAYNAPCLRIIELHNSFNFHIVTIDGGNIGRARHCSVQLPDEGAIDDDHVRIYYDYPQEHTQENRQKCYWIKNFSRHAILVNDTVVTRKKTAELKHGDIMLIGDNKLSVHIHTGMNTCNECEPGILAKEAEALAAQSRQVIKTRETSRREVLSNLKRKYALERSSPEEYKGHDYQDRAKVRRKTVGSEVDVVKPQSEASVVYSCNATPIPGATLDTVELKTQPKKEEAPITEDNKGFKLLKNMGWSGKGLGKDEQGMVQSISTTIRTERAGLGHEEAPKQKRRPMTYKERLLEKTRQRFLTLDDS